MIPSPFRFTLPVPRRWALLLILAALGVPAASCSKSSPTEPVMTGGGSTNATIVLTSGGVSDHALTVSPSNRITIMNNDSAPHEIASDPHPVHTQCPELNGPVLQPGGSFTATMAAMPETCGFHDHLNPTNAAFQGTITVK